MKIKGQREKVTYEDVEIEVSPSWVLTKIYNELVPKGLEFIEDEHWQKFWYNDYHKGVDVYQKDRRVTEEELKVHNAYKTLMEALKNV